MVSSGVTAVCGTQFNRDEWLLVWNRISAALKKSFSSDRCVRIVSLITQIQLLVVITMIKSLSVFLLFVEKIKP